MGANSQQNRDFNYFTICNKCHDDECCADPYLTFCARNEIQKIKDAIKVFPQKFQNFLDTYLISHNGAEHEWYGLRKVKGKCIFLKLPRLCLIHDAKPLHCRCFPLVWGYEEETNTLLIYIDTNPSCGLVPILSKDTQWIENMKKTIVTEVQKMEIIDRVAYEALEGDESLKLIDRIPLQ